MPSAAGGRRGVTRFPPSWRRGLLSLRDPRARFLPADILSTRSEHVPAALAEEGARFAPGQVRAVTFALVLVVLAFTAALSIAGPAWRAARIDPAQALRTK